MPPMNPRLTVACLILWGRSQVFAVAFRSAVLADEPLFLEFGGFDEPAHVGPRMRDAARAPKRRGALWYWESGVFERILRTVDGLPLCGASLHR